MSTHGKETIAGLEPGADLGIVREDLQLSRCRLVESQIEVFRRRRRRLGAGHVQRQLVGAGARGELAVHDHRVHAAAPEWQRVIPQIAEEDT